MFWTASYSLPHFEKVDSRLNSGLSFLTIKYAIVRGSDKNLCYALNRRVGLSPKSCAPDALSDCAVPPGPEGRETCNRGA